MVDGTNSRHLHIFCGLNKSPKEVRRTLLLELASSNTLPSKGDNDYVNKELLILARYYVV